MKNAVRLYENSPNLNRRNPKSTNFKMTAAKVTLYWYQVSDFPITHDVALVLFAVAG